MIARAVTLLPLPLSPTTPSTVPRGTSKLTPLSALTMPKVVLYSTWRSRR